MRERLERIVGADRVLTEQTALTEYRDDYTEADGQDPTAVVMIETADELQQLVVAAHELGRRSPPGWPTPTSAGSRSPPRVASSQT